MAGSGDELKDMNTTTFKKGCKGGPGRPKGLPNKITRNIREAFAFAFEEMGGAEKLAEWGRKNPDKFYPIYGRMAPIDMNHSGSMTLNHAGLDQLFADVFGNGEAANATVPGPLDNGQK